jgi:hypothetical protein
MINIKIKILPIMFFFIHLIYAESELERALSEGWAIEIPQKSEDQSPAFSLFSFDMDSDVVNFLNPRNILYKVPTQMNIIQIQYESDGSTKKEIDNEEWKYAEDTVQYSFESDFLMNDVIETYDELGRRVGEVRMLRETGRIYQNRTFSYDEENQMLFWYENDVLRYVLTEYKDQYKSIYIKYSMNTKYARTSKMESLALFYNTDRTISKIESTLYIGSGSTSIKTCEYSNGKITRLIYFTESTDNIIMDIQYFYKDNRYIGSYDTVNKICQQYSDFDTYGNWTTNSYYKDGVLQGMYKREILY